MRRSGRERPESCGGRYNKEMVVAAIVVAVLAVGGALAWIGLLLWGARADGRDQQAYREAEREYRKRH